MNISEFSRTTQIPRRILIHLQRKGIIEDPLLENDLIRLHFLEQIWGDKTILRAQLSRLSLKTRRSFLLTADLPTKWERYAFSRFHNLEPGQKLAMSALTEEIQTTFRFILTPQQRKRLYTIRNRAHVARYRARKRAESENAPLLPSTNK